MPLSARIIAYFTNRMRVIPGPYTLGRFSVWLNILGLLFLLFTSITFNFPTVNPVDKENMNYTSAAIGVIGLISAVTWITTGRKNFTGPQIEIPAEAVGGGRGVGANGSPNNFRTVDEVKVM